MSGRTPVPHVGANLRRLRWEAGLTQGELAQQAGVSTDTISKIENEERRVWPRTLHRLAVALGVQVGDLLRPPAQQVIDLSAEGYSGARAAVADASPEQRQVLVSQYRADTVGATWLWKSEPSEMRRWRAESSIMRYAAALWELWVADGDYPARPEECQVLVERLAKAFTDLLAEAFEGPQQ